MESKHHRNTKDTLYEEEAAKAEDTIPVIASSTSPPPSSSSSSSPSHEFSFDPSVHSSSTPVSNNGDFNHKSASKAPPFAIDLSPADDIFFHGHLLPLHLLSHLPVSPRSSLDTFTLPIREFIDDQKLIDNDKSTGCHGYGFNNIQSDNGDSDIQNHINDNNGDETKTRSSSKPKSFSLFGWRKGFEVGDKEAKEKQKKRLRFEVSRILKRYVRMMRPLFFFKGRRENLQFQRQPYSFSGNLSWKNKQEFRGRRVGYSAPASMRTSPTNSGHLVATTAIPSSTTSDSTMDELQAAIQAAIAHCKKSIAAEEKIKC